MAGEKQDLLNREKTIENISEIIKTTNLEEDNRAFAIDGNWGIGKTFIIDKVEEKFKDEKEFLIFRYNAWNYNYYEEPLVAIITSIIDQLNDYYTSGFKGIAKATLRTVCGSLVEILKTLGKSTAILLGLDKISNVEKILKIADEVKDCKKRVKKKIDDGQTPIDNNIDNYATLKETLNKLRKCLLELNKKIIFIVDEIDRCLPDYAIKVLERTHHIFNTLKGSMTIYVLSKVQLEKLIKTYYGEGFDIEAYMQKLIEFTVNIDVGLLDETKDDILKHYLRHFEYEDKKDVEELILFFKSLTDDIEIRQKIRIINKIDKVHEIFVREKCDLSICYFEICYVMFYEFYKHDTERFKVLKLEPKKGDLLNPKLKAVYENTFKDIKLGQITYMGYGGSTLDTLDIQSMTEYKNLLFVYLRHEQNLKDGEVKITKNKEVQEAVDANYQLIDKFIKGMQIIL